MNDMSCPVCKETQFVETQPVGGDSTTYRCAICGNFIVTEEAEEEFRLKPTMPKLSAWIREHKEYGRDIPLLLSNRLDDLIANLPAYSPSQKQLLLLKAIERRTRYPGFEVKLNGWTDYVLAWAGNENEFEYLLKSLADRGLVTWCGKGAVPEIIITAGGWEYLEKQASEVPFIDQAFVAMSFSKDMEQIWKDGLQKGIKKAGYKAIRIDKESHLDRIDAKIITEIKNSRFLVADVTSHNPGVYFEAGFALGLGRPVIWTVRKDQIDEVHFDTRQYSHIVWETTKDLAEELYFRICANIGKFSKSKSDRSNE